MLTVPKSYPPQCLCPCLFALRRNPGLPLVRNVSAMASSDFGRAGLSHISISSKVHHGNLKVSTCSVLAPTLESLGCTLLCGCRAACGCEHSILT